MKTKSLLTLLALTLSFSALSRPNEPEPAANHCVPVPDSKQYSGNTNFHDPYPRRVSFECDYRCHHNGRVEVISGVMTVTVNNMDEDAYGTTCQGVKLKKVPWGWDYDGFEGFYAFDAAAPEVRRFAFENISRNNPIEARKLAQLKITLGNVGGTFKTVPNLEFNKAGDMLLKIAGELPAKTKELDKAIKRIVELNGKIQMGGTAEGVLLAQISAHAAWRIPSHQFKK